jgi:hypothetical protein
VGRRILVGAVCYGALLAVLAGILTGRWPAFLPPAVSVRIGHNSEGFLLALLLAPWIQFARPRLAGTPREWPTTAAVALACAAVGVFLLVTDPTPRVRTLNEAFLAAAVLIPYLQLRRPLRPGHALALSVVALAVMVLGERAQTVTDLAEVLGVLALAPIGLDLVDRAVLDPAARPSPRLRYGWYAFLVVAPIVFSVLEYRVGAGGAAVRYAVRITEAFVCLLLVELYFAVLLGRRTPHPPGAPTGRRR